MWLMLTASQLLLTVLQVLLTFSRCWLRRRWGTGSGKQRGFRPQVSQLLSISPFLFSDGANCSFISYLGFGFGVLESKQVGFDDLLTSLDNISRRRRWRAGRWKQRGFRPQVSQLFSLFPFLFSDGANCSFISYLSFGFGFGVSESKQVGFADLLTSLDTISRRRR